MIDRLDHVAVLGVQIVSNLRAIESTAQRQELLRLARAEARRILEGVEPLGVEKSVIAGRFGGVFVTFWRKKVLRGCVGTFKSTSDVAATVVEMTRSALRDSRFAANPITAGELDALEIEISVLSEPQPTDDPASLIPGEHGVIIKSGERTGCFLPKVATERGWSAEAFLSHCCTMKAGLAADAWRNAETQVKLFRADVLTESEFGHDAARRP